jgi:hypothetical protein
VTAIAAGGVEHWHTDLCASVTLHHACHWIVVYYDRNSSVIAAVTNVVDCTLRIVSKQFSINPPIKKNINIVIIQLFSYFISYQNHSITLLQENFFFINTSMSLKNSSI